MSKIPLSFINNKYFTFNADGKYYTFLRLCLLKIEKHCFPDYMKLRTEYRIIGNLIGCLTSHPRNISKSGLPAIYSSCEVQLLLDKNVVVLISKIGLQKEPTSSIEEEYKVILENQKIEQNDYFKEARLEQTKNLMDKIIKGKKNKLRKSGVKDEDMNVTPESVLKEEKEKIPDITESNMYYQTPTEHPFEVESKKVILPPNTSLNYRIFCDLWEKGKFITNGDTFGCDFLVYPGDPLQYHASHVVHILENPAVSAKQLISHARLSVMVNKTCVYAFLDETGEVAYQTVEWTGNTISDKTVI